MKQPKKKHIEVVHRMNTTNKAWGHINKIFFVIGSSVEAIHIMDSFSVMVKHILRSLNKMDSSFNYIH